MQAIEWCHYRCRCVTRDPDFKRRSGLSATAGLSCFDFFERGSADCAVCQCRSVPILSQCLFLSSDQLYVRNIHAEVIIIVNSLS